MPAGKGRRPCGWALLCGVLTAAPAVPQDLAVPDQPDGGRAVSLTWRTSVKASGLVSRAPEAPALFPARDSAVSFWRLRLEPTVRVGEGLTIGVAYEQRLRLFTGSSGLASGGILPPESSAPFRVRQLDWALATRAGSSWRHEIDRAFVGWHLPGAEVTIGRQAIGWGRGVVFGAVDVFSPFSPLEADREWRRGVDAIRADVKLADRASVDAVAAFGPTIDRSAFAARVRGYAGDVDLELVGGRRGQDLFAGLTTSAAIGDAEIHAEGAVFRATDVEHGRRVDRAIAKAVAGASYRFAIGNGLLAYLEYHYSGFGVTDADEIVSRLADAAFNARFSRGDTQILTRQAFAAVMSTEISPEVTMTGLWLQNPSDGSGLFAPSATISLGDKLSVLVSVYVPYGRPPQGVTLRSEYGTSALSGFLQVRLYS